MDVTELTTEFVLTASFTVNWGILTQFHIIDVSIWEVLHGEYIEYISF